MSDVCHWLSPAIAWCVAEGEASASAAGFSDGVQRRYSDPTSEVSHWAHGVARTVVRAVVDSGMRDFMQRDGLEREGGERTARVRRGGGCKGQQGWRAKGLRIWDKHEGSTDDTDAQRVTA